ncbi:MAG: hypothetical protein GTN81_00905 [Proteobacteria bacterium]|nr:hypothetical protein [Pseudomonadota bacterium]
MLEISAVMNSSIEDILAFRTCCGIRAFDLNLEIHVINRGDLPVEIPSYFDLRDDSGFYRVDTLMPHGVQSVGPGETFAFYCTMDEVRWKRARELVFYDIEGNIHSTNISQ